MRKKKYIMKCVEMEELFARRNVCFRRLAIRVSYTSAGEEETGMINQNLK